LGTQKNPKGSRQSAGEQLCGVWFAQIAVRIFATSRSNIG
jgi:hypothetical protein